jgi:hypothetical protein
MFKKIMIALVLTLVLSLGVFGAVNTIFAQDVDVEEKTDEQVIEPQEYMYAYEYALQNGELNCDDPIMTQTRTQAQLRELQEDGECTGECPNGGEPQQLQQQLGAGNQGGMQGQQLRYNNESGSGDCVGLGMQGNKGN